MARPAPGCRGGHADRRPSSSGPVPRARDPVGVAAARPDRQAVAARRQRGCRQGRKGRVDTFRDLVANSHQFNAVSRSSLLLAPHPDDEELRVLAWAKGNHAGLVPTLEFRIEVAGFDAPNGHIETVRAVEWGESDV